LDNRFTGSTIFTLLPQSIIRSLGKAVTLLDGVGTDLCRCICSSSSYPPLFRVTNLTSAAAAAAAASFVRHVSGRKQHPGGGGGGSIPKHKRKQNGPGVTSVSYKGKHVKMVTPRANGQALAKRLGDGHPACVAPRTHYPAVLKL